MGRHGTKPASLISDADLDVMVGNLAINMMEDWSDIGKFESSVTVKIPVEGQLTIWSIRGRRIEKKFLADLGSIFGKSEAGNWTVIYCVCHGGQVNATQGKDLTRGSVGKFLIEIVNAAMTRNDGENVDGVDFQTALDDIAKSRAIVIGIMIFGIGEEDYGLCSAGLPLETVHGVKHGREGGFWHVAPATTDGQPINGGIEMVESAREITHFLRRKIVA